MAETWFIIFLVLLFIELITVNLVSIWFALGTLASLITTIFTNNVTIQIVVFVIVSTIALLITKPFIKKIRTREIIPTNLDRVIGSTGIVTKEITKNNYGEVKILGSIWTATSSRKIKKGSLIKVLKIDGVKLLVEEENKEEEK